jgi:hypothetical protein
VPTSLDFTSSAAFRSAGRRPAERPADRDVQDDRGPAAPLSFDHLDLRVLADGRHSVPTRLRLEVDGQKRDLPLPAITDQAPENASTLVHLEFPSVTGRAVRATITGVREERSLRFASDATPLLPAGIAELGVPGLHVPAPTGAGGGALDSTCRSDLVAIDGRWNRPVLTIRRPAPAVMALAVTPCDPADAMRIDDRARPGRHAHNRAVSAGYRSTACPRLGVPARERRRWPHPAARARAAARRGRTATSCAHVTGAMRLFWMVLGESRALDGASVAGGAARRRSSTVTPTAGS